MGVTVQIGNETRDFSEASETWIDDQIVRPIDVDGGPGDDTVHTGLNYAGLSGGVHGSGNFVYLFTPGGDFVTFENVETLIFNDGTYDTATGNFVACFAAGTRILAERGQVAVEDLLTGARVLAHTGDGRMSSRRIIWIGHRSIDCRRHPKPWLVWPVRVMADAFGPGRPRRDVFLSPDHAVFVDGVLIPIRYLINGRSVAQVPAPAVTYFHVELARHAVLSAEGLPAESYLDTGHRADFTSRGHKATLHPDVASLRWEAEACAPLIIAGPKLAAVRRWVNARAAIAADPRVFAAPSSGFGRTEDTGEPLMS